MSFPLDLQDIIGAALLALIVTWVIKTVSKIFRAVITRSASFDYKPGHLEEVLQKCCHLFPIDQLRFKGVTFRRGMEIRVTTLKNTTIIGQFVGTNKDDMFCVITSRSVVAQELQIIDEIQKVEAK